MTKDACLQIHHRPWKSRPWSDINSKNSKQEGPLDILQWFYHRGYRKTEMNTKRWQHTRKWDNHSCMSDSLIDPWPEHHFSPITPTRNCGQEVTHSAVQSTANLPLALTVHTYQDTSPHGIIFWLSDFLCMPYLIHMRSKCIITFFVC